MAPKRIPNENPAFWESCSEWALHGNPRLGPSLLIPGCCYSCQKKKHNFLWVWTMRLVSTKKLKTEDPLPNDDQGMGTLRYGRFPLASLKEPPPKQKPAKRSEAARLGEVPLVLWPVDPGWSRLARPLGTPNAERPRVPWPKPQAPPPGRSGPQIAFWGMTSD